jgi:hypothetical protein
MTAAISPSASAMPARDLASRTVTAGLAGGAVDLVYASVMGLVGGRGVLKVWQGVASGWIGKAAGDGGLATGALGVATHFGIAICMAGAYALAATRLPILYRRWTLFAPLYGLILYGIMYRIVLPLRFPGAGGWKGGLSVLDICAHVGLAVLAVFVLSRPAPNVVRAAR